MKLSHREPEDRYAAVFDLHQSMAELGLPEWSSCIVGWLGQYDGLDSYIPAEHDPLLCTRRAFADMVDRRRQGERVLASDVVERLEHEPFLRYRVDWAAADGTQLTFSWKAVGPDGERFWDYVADRPSQAAYLRVRELPHPAIKPHVLRNVLVLGYLRFTLGRVDARPLDMGTQCVP